MREISIHIDEMPKTWNELSLQQLQSVTKCLLQKLSKTRFRVEMLRIFTDLLILQKPHTYRNRTPHFLVKFPHHEQCFLSADTIRDMGATFDWLTEPSDLHAQLLPVVKVGFKKYYGPADTLTNITFNEYISANELYTVYMATKNEKFLNQFIAALYRLEDKKYIPNDPNFSGDRREPFNPFTLEKRAVKIAKLDDVSKTIILLYYTGCRRELQRRFPDVFNGEESSDPKKGIPGLAGLVSRLNNGDATKNESIRNSMLYDILEELQKNEEISQKMKSK